MGKGWRQPYRRQPRGFVGFAAACAVLVGLLAGGGSARSLDAHISVIDARFYPSEYATHYKVNEITGFEAPIKATWTLQLTCVDPGCPNPNGTDQQELPDVDTACDNDGVGTKSAYVQDLSQGEAAEFVWHHPDTGIDPKYHCDHKKMGPRGHQGLITVVVSDAHTHCTATYKGTNTSDINSIQNGTATAAACCPHITVTDTGIAPERTGQSYVVFFRASGGTGPYAFRADSLPPGLALSLDGRLSARPTAAGTYTFVVTATDAEGCSGEEQVKLTVTAPRPVTPPKPSVPPQMDFVLLHKQVMHELAVADLDDAEHGGIVNVLGKKWNEYALPTFQPKTEAQKKIKKVIEKLDTVKKLKDKVKIIDQIIEVAGDATSVVFYVDYYWAEAQAQDPPDFRSTEVALPAKPPAGPYLTGASIPPDLLSAANALLANIASYGTTTRALLTDLQRTEGAVVARKSAQVRRLAIETAKLADEDASIVAARAALRDALAAAMNGLGLRFTLDGDVVRLLGSELARTGLSPRATALATKLGATGALGSSTRKAFKSRAAKLAAGFATPDAFHSAAQRSADKRLSASLSRLASKLRALAKAS